MSLWGIRLAPGIPHWLSILKSKTVQTVLTIAVLIALAGISQVKVGSQINKTLLTPPGITMKPPLQGVRDTLTGDVLNDVLSRATDPRENARYLQGTPKVPTRYPQGTPA